MTEQDYSLWSTLEIKGSSDKGTWVSYNLSYESGIDTLFVKNKSATKTYAFPKGTDGFFGSENWFGCRLAGKRISVLNLNSAVKTAFDSVRQFAFSNDGATLIVLDESNNLILDYQGKRLAQIENVTNVYLNSTKTAMVYTVSKETSLLYYCSFDGAAHFEKLEAAVDASFENIVWQKNGTSFSFLKNYKNTTDARNGRNLFLYRIDERKVYSLDFATEEKINPTSAKKTISEQKVVLSDDGKHVFFYVTEPRLVPMEKPIVQIWNGNDSWTYSQIQMEGKNRDKHFYVWSPDTGSCVQITTEEQTNLLLSGDQKFAIAYNPMGKQPQFSFSNKFEWSIQNLDVGKGKDSSTKKVCEADEVSASFGGKFVLYRVDENWFVYELATGKYTDITKNFPREFRDLSNDRAGIKPLFGIVGWSKGDSEVVVQDAYDLWSIRLKDLKTVRLTKGREVAISFRVLLPFGSTKRIPNFDGYTFPLIEIENGFYLKATGILSKASGYFWWNGTENKIVYRDKAFNDLCYSKDNGVLYFKEEDFTMSPQLKSIALATKKEVTLFKSNPQQSHYFWGTSSLINYKDSNGTPLQGALFYPANYDKEKKYPMVVYIYEKLSDHLHNYVTPTVLNGGGLNLSTITSQGYFVLYPDIKHVADKVGFSATDCVVNATKAVIALGLVSSDKIALMGHSFGGYEAAFISTQTDIFCTVIAGAGVSDIVSSYLSIGWNNGRAEIFRYEDDQWRMSKSLFDGMETYLQNSPITHAKNVTVPLLLWSGEQDRQVHYYQTIAFYTALRRLGKKEVMLLYPDNRHRLTNGKSQQDFNEKIEQWLGAFCKDTILPNWIRKALD
ncbi:MAG: prolyl oligopeptidase family serine peptidase [Flavobacteriaceae bacterium]|nr:prolyl oligopeptidase family serine peptidase [Flavobacteriaceae bacterium]